MSAATVGRRLSVPVLALALLVVATVAAGVLLGRASVFVFGPPAPDVVVAEATLANKDNWLTIVKSDDLEKPLAFDARSVAWVDRSGTFWDGFGATEPPCLQVNRSARVEVSYVALPDGGGSVTQVRCLSDA